MTLAINCSPGGYREWRREKVRWEVDVGELGEVEGRLRVGFGCELGMGKSKREVEGGV